MGGTPGDEARWLSMMTQGTTLAAFGITTWATCAGSIDVLHDLPTGSGWRSYDDLLSSGTTAGLDGNDIRVAAVAVDHLQQEQHAATSSASTCGARP